MPTWAGAVTLYKLDYQLKRLRQRKENGSSSFFSKECSVVCSQEFGWAVGRHRSPR